RGGLGIERGRIRITDRSGDTAVIDLRHALTIDDVLDEIDAASAIEVDARLSADGRAIELVDSSDGGGSIVVQEWGGGTTANSLGMLGSSAGSDTFAGATIAFLGSQSQLASIGSGVPIVDGVPTFAISIDGTQVLVDLGAGASGSPPRASTLGEAIARINAAIASAGFGSIASISIAESGDRLAVKYSGAGTLSFGAPTPTTDSDAPSRATLRALGLDETTIDGSAPSPSSVHHGRRILFGMHDVALTALDGGIGITLAGSLTLVDSLGRSVTISNLGEADSVETLLERIRADAGAAGLDLEVGLDSSAARLRLRDLSNGAGSLAASGEVAAQLGIGANGGTATLHSRDLRRADVGLGTSLERIAGHPVDGSITITSRSGAAATIAITAGMTLADLSRAVAGSGIPVTVGVNAWGDAVEVVDHSNGPASLSIVDSTGGAAAALRIAGASSTGSIDGTRTRHLSLDGSESAEMLVSMLDGFDGIDASLVTGDDGELRLSIESLATGRRNDLSLSITGTDLELVTASRGRDARILISPDDGAGTLLTRASNHIDDLIAGAILDLHAASDEVVTVTIAPSDQPIFGAVAAFVTALRQAISQLRQATSVNPETDTRGALYGGVAATRARNALRSLAGSTFGPDGRRLSHLGITISGDGSVTLDEQKLAATLEADPDGARAMLADADGVAERFGVVLGAFVEAATGAFDADASRMDRSIDSANATIDRINESLARRRSLLLARFTAMELAIERLRAQQSSMQAMLASLERSGA
ncbi:MAG: hypothetical protein FJ253_00510, partial [Phycisphaerae bacterium]|nr:hypothetical protein [Phycisphaerae bacterium]